MQFQARRSERAKRAGAQARGPGVERTLMRPGGLSYLEIPAADPRRSAAFYKAVLGWKIDYRDTGEVKFSDATGHLIGSWDTDRVAARETGLLPYFYVDRIDDAVTRAIERGGEVVRAPYPEGDLWVATLRDPAGNLIGIWQAGPRQG